MHVGRYTWNRQPGIRREIRARNFPGGADKSAAANRLTTMGAEKTVPRHDSLCHYCVTYKLVRGHVDRIRMRRRETPGKTPRLQNRLA